ncbi:helix-turn-helix domain-containing protein [Pollutimonas harenae]|uniref:Helix-turn-helix domain-containing protein n=1 Tax=Pollutimonas harenae TaxID=657015 RepID=A0A853H569_9BURK|nr:helix-turn-helix domain-containing protein [Pollutimonas harenae]NYT86325.1 helix-turn-helix domain-containing protein [Pollutimonas harenae]TEA69917.1 helix-turn-helix domain-containing protein [Pollutimonas harenae]
MNGLIRTAAQALAAGDPLAALNQIALCNDAPAIALRGIAMAQLGDLVRAKSLVRQAARSFGRKNPVAHARCIVAEAEIAFASRDLGWPTKELDEARATLEAHGDHVNAAHALYLDSRRHLLMGRTDDAGRLIAGLDPEQLPPALSVGHELIVAGIAMRRLQAKPAREALLRCRHYAQLANIPALSAEVEQATQTLSKPVARSLAHGQSRLLLLEDTEALLASEALIIDACRRAVRHREVIIPLARRPLLFVLTQLLSQAWPEDVPRNKLIAQAFRTRYADESHRARLRVEIGRLRMTLKPLVNIVATQRGYKLAPTHASEVVTLARLTEEPYAALLALLADGEPWSSSALALALDASQRTIQRALESLAANGKVQSFGGGRARRWTIPPVPGFTTILLLPVPLSRN